VGRGAPDQRRWRDRLPHHPVPRGGDRLCDRLAIIDDGRIIAEGSPEELKVQMGHDVVSVSLAAADMAATEAAMARLPGLERVVAAEDALALYVEDGAGQVAEIVRRLEHEQIRIGAINVARPSLDDVFLRATGPRLEGREANDDAQEA
jgi:ABC-2 type transport system ATP-binding protein